MEITPSPSPHRFSSVSDVEKSATSYHSPSEGSTVLFPRKLHQMLRACMRDDREDIVSWLSQGNAFKVHNVPVFVSEILPLFFKQTKYKSFQRQLNLWGFERIQNGPEKGAYYHIQFLRDKPNLCCHLTRHRAKKTSPSNNTNTTKNTLFHKKLPKAKKAPPIPPRYSRIRRKVSEGSIEDYEEATGKINSNSDDLADFEGITFHLLEQERYEELYLKLTLIAPETQYRDKKKSNILEELELGLFGVPKMSSDAYEVRP
mmetsp:Transcript_17011/g.38841  ORF Transcript_17011/g.38841 Transcript_17011/m.38841 type:complete len:259 (-) Transcript_17011:293-1069(-)|eukprot:CAMPEP_0201132532 /NCGR_PEP_ID=MMETSP0850-20130426/46068_1 /ASSEMBLY_ACC=CAM_ASM_000622 /TAXON_ID=183588 /ORGANISM="Pseudo-nitzschia fraudulenta, Strain WWA7" /LENGTH=258 /DNA_ID=CAMNT_0047402899 /DNA_START=111 /DNA_END=887 /DNA_ORIENTATION=-